ncbi:transcription termination/antitermination protein NusA [bacterium]|nr:transcription termination/antitermination protein NusA [bacterium]
MFQDLKTFISALSQIAEEKGLPQEKVLEVVELALAAAYKKDYGKKGEIVKAKINPETGEVKFWQIKEVVDDSMVYTEEEWEDVQKEREGEDKDKSKEKETEESEEKKVKFNPKKHIMIDEAKKIDPNVKPGDELVFPLEVKQDYGRIAAQTAKQVILQKLKELEREMIYEEYKSKEGEVLSGIIQRREGENILVDLGKTFGVLPLKEQIPGENYRQGQRMKFYVKKVEEAPKGPAIILSRNHPKLVSKLFEIEVPEISAEQVVIKAIAREPGSRTKIAVASTEENIDPIGAMVGQRGTRVAAVMEGLGGEKIDIVKWSEDPEEFIANSLSPAKVSEIKIDKKGVALAIVPDDQLSLAIGKNGQNVRLAASLCGWKIDVKSQSELEEEKEEKTEKQPKRKEDNRQEKDEQKEEKEGEKKIQENN